MNTHSHKITRRTLLQGVGVTMALPWLESLSGWGAEAPSGAAGRVSEAFRGSVHGQRHQPQELVRQRIGCRHGTEQESRTFAPASVAAERRLRAVQQTRHRRRHPSRPDRQHPIGRRSAKGGRAARRRQRGSGNRRAFRGGDRTAEPCARVRATDHRLSRVEFLDGLQLAHLLARRQFAGADGGLPVFGLRQPLRQPGQSAHDQHPRPREGAGRGSQSRGQPRRPGQARRIPYQRPRGGEARSSAPAPTRTGPTARPATAAGPPSRCRAPTMGFPKISASTCG